MADSSGWYHRIGVRRVRSERGQPCAPKRQPCAPCAPLRQPTVPRVPGRFELAQIDARNRIESLEARILELSQRNRELLLIHKADQLKMNALSGRFLKPIADLEKSQLRRRIKFLASLLIRSISGEKASSCSANQTRKLMRVLFAEMHPKSSFFGLLTAKAQLCLAKKHKLSWRSVAAVSALVRKFGGDAPTAHSLCASDQRERERIQELFAIDSENLIVKSSDPPEDCAVLHAVRVESVINHVTSRVPLVDNFLPEDFAGQIWIGSAVNKGGKHCKMGITVVNAGLANSPHSFFPVCMHEGNESYENCRKTFKRHFDQLSDLKELTVSDSKYRVQVFLGGDGSALPCLTGQRGACAKYPCFLCEIHDSQLPYSPGVPLRTHESLAEDYAKFQKLVSDFELKRKRSPNLAEISAISLKTHSVDSAALHRVPLDQICIPILHIRLGLIGETMEAIEGLSISQNARNNGAVGVLFSSYKDCQRGVTALAAEWEQSKKDLKRESDELDDFQQIEECVKRVHDSQQARGSQRHGHGLRSRSQTPVLTNRECAAGAECIAAHIAKLKLSILVDEGGIVCKECKRAFHPVCVAITSREMLEKHVNSGAPKVRGRKRKVDESDYICTFCHSNGKTAVQIMVADLPSRISKQVDEVDRRKREVASLELKHNACMMALSENARTPFGDILHIHSMPRKMPLKQMHGGLITKVIGDVALARLDDLFQQYDRDLASRWTDLLSCLRSWRVLEGFFKAQFYSDAEIAQYGNALDDFCRQLGDTLPHTRKLPMFHWLLCHTEPFLRKWKSLSIFCEQGIEHAHHVFNGLLDQYKFSYKGGNLLFRATVEMVYKNVTLSS